MYYEFEQTLGTPTQNSCMQSIVICSTRKALYSVQRLSQGSCDNECGIFVDIML